MSDFIGEDIKRQALLLARDNKKVEPEIQAIYWMPCETEVRLIEVQSNVVKCLSGAVEPFYFDPSPTDGLPAPSGIALIRPDEFGTLNLPGNWGNWEDALLLELSE